MDLAFVKKVCIYKPPEVRSMEEAINTPQQGVGHGSPQGQTVSTGC